MLETLSTVFPDFCDFNEIGSGGFSVVFSAIHTKIKTLEIAIKVVNKYDIMSADNKQNFEFEVKILKKLDFPFIITFYNIRENNEFYFISMELAKKGTLLNMVNNEKTLTKENSLRIFCQLSATLYYLHNVINSIHRDIKVENIMFDDNMNVRLIDFGFSQLLKNKSKDSNKSKDKKFFTTLCGSYPYAAPEMLRLSPYSKPIDIWALGIVLYVCLVGKLPFEDPSIPKLAKMIVFNEPEYPEEIDDDFRNLIKKLLTKNPSERLTIDEIKDCALVKNSPFSVYFDVLGNENFLVRNIVNQQNDSDDVNENSEETREVYLDSEIINKLIDIGLDPTKVFTDGTEEMLLYRALRKQKITSIIGDDKLFRETLNMKNVPMKQLLKITLIAKKPSKTDKQNAEKSDENQNQDNEKQSKVNKKQTQENEKQNQENKKQVKTIEKRNQENEKRNQNNEKQTKEIEKQTQENDDKTCDLENYEHQDRKRRKSHSHVEFGPPMQIQNYSAGQNQKTSNQQMKKQSPSSCQHSDDEIIPNYQDYKKIKSYGLRTPLETDSKSPNAASSSQLQLQPQPVVTTPQQSLQLQIQPKTMAHTFHFQTYRSPANTEVSKTFMRVSRKTQRSSSVTAGIKSQPIPANLYQPLGKTSGQPSQLSSAQSSAFQSQQANQSQIMIIQKKRRAPSLGSHIPAFQSSNGQPVSSLFAPSSVEFGAENPASSIRKIRQSGSIDQYDQSNSGRGSHNQPSGREVAPIMRPRKFKAKGSFMNIISK